MSEILSPLRWHRQYWSIDGANEVLDLALDQFLAPGGVRSGQAGTVTGSVVFQK